MRPKFRLAPFAMLVGLACATAVQGQDRPEFKVGWSIYAGWTPWGYAAETGVVRRWADKYGLSIEVTRFDDYNESLDRYTEGTLDAVTLTNIDGLSVPAASGLDTTAVIVGDFSNGNDALILKGGATLAEIAGRRVHLVEFSVSDYLLARALESARLSDSDVQLVNMMDPDTVGVFKQPEVTAMVTWNPMVAEIDALVDAAVVFDSSRIPGEIVDLMVANTQVLTEHPDFGRALAGIWYETAALLVSETPEGAAARAAMGAASGTDQAGFERQLAATKLFAVPGEAVNFVASPDFGAATERVRAYIFNRGLLGLDATSPDVVGIEMPDGTIQGDPGNVKFRFDAKFMQLAAEGAL